MNFKTFNSNSNCCILTPWLCNNFPLNCFALLIEHNITPYLGPRPLFYMPLPKWNQLNLEENVYFGQVLGRERERERGEGGEEEEKRLIHRIRNDRPSCFRLVEKGQCQRKFMTSKFRLLILVYYQDVKRYKIKKIIERKIILIYSIDWNWNLYFRGGE